MNNTEKIRKLLEKEIRCTTDNAPLKEILSLLPPPCERCGGSREVGTGVGEDGRDFDGTSPEIIEPCPCQAPAGIIKEFVDNMQEQCEAHKGLNRVESRAKSGDYLAIKLLQACTHLEAQAKYIKELEDGIETVNAACVKKTRRLQAENERLEGENRKLQNQKEYVYKPEIATLKATIERLEGITRSQ